MTIPFVDLFQKIRARFLAKTQHDTAPDSPVGRNEKPSSHGLSKTVLPNARQSSARPDPFLVAAGAPSGAAPSLTLGHRTILSASGPVALRAHDLPPKLAASLEPNMERAISLQLGDFIEQIPAGYIRPIDLIDANRSIALKASEIEKGMSEQNPSISLSSLYQQVPEIFLRAVAPGDPARVPLPYEKVLEQFSNARVRSDQVRESPIPQLETPILKAAIEDTERFGTQVEPLESSVLPPVPVEPATAEAIASAEPEAVARETVRSTPSKSASPHPVISLSAPKVEAFPEKISPMSPAAFDKPSVPPEAVARETVSLTSSQSASPHPPVISLSAINLETLSGKNSPASPIDFDAPPAPPAPEKIPFQLPPNGMGASASERVPASNGPPVPTISAPPAGLPPIPFQSPEETFDSKTSEASKMPITRHDDAPTVHLAEIAPDFGKTSQKMESGTSTITLALKPLLQKLPAFQLNGDPSAVGEDVRVQFPLSLVQPQLVTGRVVVPAKTFHDALPEPQRALFIIDPAETPVALPLAEVLKNLPDGVLKMRDDQQKSFAEADFETPFSIKAKEDAERLQAPVATTPAKPVDEIAGELKSDLAPEEEIDGKQVVARVCQLPGVKACQIMFRDGLGLAGNFPAEVKAEGLCAVAPALLQRISAHMLESRLGPLDAMTLQSAHSAITFFMKENVCLAALHSDAAALASETQMQVSELVEKLSHTFAQTGASHVDH